MREEKRERAFLLPAEETDEIERKRKKGKQRRMITKTQERTRETLLPPKD